MSTPTGRVRGGSHLMSRGLKKRFQEFRDTGDASVMEGLEGTDSDEVDPSIRRKGSDLPDPNNSKKQVPAKKHQNKSNV